MVEVRRVDAMSRERALLAECARVMRYVTLQPSDPNDTGSNNVDDQRAYYAALDAAERALLAEPEPTPYNKCSVCCGMPLKSGRECICGGVGTEAAEMHGLRMHCFELQYKLDARTPRSRAEAEAMVEAYDSTRDRMQIAAVDRDVAAYHQGAFDMAKARTALLAALCGEGV